MDTNSSRVTRKMVAPTVPRTGTNMRLGAVTQGFFLKGEEQEASGYQNLTHDDVVLTSPKLEFTSFDTIPRRRGPLLAIVGGLVALSAIGAVTWKSFHWLSRPGSSVAAASRAMVQAPAPTPTASPAPTTVPPVGETEATTHGMPAAVAAPTDETTPPAMAPTVEGTAAALAAETAPAIAPKRVPAAKTTPSAVIELSPATEGAPARAAETATETQPGGTKADRAGSRTGGSALHGYVWSPEAHALVPVGSLGAPPASGADEPRPAPSAAPAVEPRAAEGVTTSPAPFEAEPATPPAPAPDPATNQAPIVE